VTEQRKQAAISVAKKSPSRSRAVRQAAKAAPVRRIAGDNAKNRARLVDAAERVLTEEGYAAVTARRVAEVADLKVQLIYYYFQTMDDLILAVVRKNTEKRLERFAQTMASPEPFRALWELMTDRSRALPTAELMALANHNVTIRAEVVAAARQFRMLQTEALGRVLALKGVDQNEFPAAGIATIVAAVARAMVQDTVLGVPEGYAEAMKLIERGLTFLRHGGPARASGK
jgi:TetR/AcrR family transcriptional regulator